MEDKNTNSTRTPHNTTKDKINKMNNIKGDPYEFHINQTSDFAQIEFDLRPKQTIIADGGTLCYQRDGVSLGEISNSGGGGFFAGIGRALAGESMFLNKYTGSSTKKNIIAFSSPIPGRILYLELQPGEEIAVSRGTFLCSSPNIKINGKLNLRGFLSFGQEEGAVLPRIKCVGDTMGHLWLGVYGEYKKHILKKNEYMIVNNGIFLSLSRDKKLKNERLYEIVKVGKTLMSSFLGREGFGMKFVGPCTLYTQSHNFNALVANIEPRLKRK